MLIVIIIIIIAVFAVRMISDASIQHKCKKETERIVKENHEFTKKYINEKNGKDLIK